ncbi:hypothetical protein KL930_003292 [Ogataea haglerorum]|nr:hypothetical protein KL950_002294 [Ogataea haglerorum]KAG7776170.1 hypothetical protein KL930_003292 [Ogataea haglerorum]KAG7776729.1 hypothetical protein KL922_003422 [Ogataea haglerorum]
MSSVLRDAANNIFITTATILDKLTYKLSGRATGTVVPHNNESLVKPLSQTLKQDFDRYNQILDEHNMNLREAEQILRYLKVKSVKDEEMRKIKQEEAEMKKKIEGEASKKKQEQEPRQTEQQVSGGADDVFGSADDLMNLDLDNFRTDFLDFGEASERPQNDDMMKDIFDMKTAENSEPSAMDSLTDLNLDFLDQPAQAGPEPAAPAQEDESGLMPTDQMENLFSQFDELVNSGDY